MAHKGLLGLRCCLGTTGRASAVAVWVMGWEQAGRQGRAGQGRAGQAGRECGAGRYVLLGLLVGCWCYLERCGCLVLKDKLDDVVHYCEEWERPLSHDSKAAMCC